MMRNNLSARLALVQASNCERWPRVSGHRRGGFCACRLLVALLLLLLVMLPAGVRAQLTYSTNNGALIVTGYSGRPSALSIPDSTNGLPVVGIGDYAFYYCSSLTSLTLPHSLTGIGEQAFWSCTSLTNFTFPTNLNSIGDYAFYGCISLTNLTLPNSLTSIGNKVFYSCASLTDCTLPTNLTSIGDAVFHDCTSLRRLKLPTSLTSIGNEAFYGCTSLTNFTFPIHLTSIGDEAFAGCTSLSSLTLPNSLTSIGNGVFCGCASLTNCTFPTNLASIGDEAFAGCTSLRSLRLPNSLTSIGYDAFSNCSSLTNFTFPTNLTSIGHAAFYNCTSLSSLTLPNSLISIGDYTFVFCTSLTSLTIPDSVIFIQTGAFNYCTALREVIFLGDAPWTRPPIFYGDTNLDRIVYLPGAVGWCPTFCDIPTELATDGLQMNLGPAKAVAAGAAWSVDDGAWLSSGFVLSNLAVGSHTVTFKPLDGWKTPAPQSVTVSFMQVSALSATYSQRATLQVSASPAAGGRVSGGGSFALDSWCRVEAIPNTGYVFAGWSEGATLLGNALRVRFQLTGDRSLVAHFVPGPFLPVKGQYSGLFYVETNAMALESCGSLRLTVGSTGVFSGQLHLGPSRCALSGQFDSTGQATRTLRRGKLAPLTVALQLDLTNGVLFGRVSDGVWTAELLGYRAGYDGKAKCAPQAAHYTLALPADTSNWPASPSGDGWGTLSVGRNGAVSLHGKLADGTAFSRSSVVFANGLCPLYLPLSGGRGMLWSWLGFSADAPASLGGQVVWTNWNPKASVGAHGLRLVSQAMGERYAPPGRGTNVFGANTSINLILTLTGDWPGAGSTNYLVLEANPNARLNNGLLRLDGPKLSLGFTPSTGAFRGSVFNAATAQWVPFSGVLLQGQALGTGFFLEAGRSGALRLEPAD